MEPRKPDGSRHLLESWIEVGSALRDHPELMELLYDPVTGLPTIPLEFPTIKSLLEDRGEVSLLCVNVTRYSRIEEIYGWRAFDEVMREVAEVLVGIVGVKLRESDVVAELMNSGNAFVIVLSPPRTTACIDPNARFALARRVEGWVRERLEERLEPALYRKFGCHVGAATVCLDEDARIERLLYHGLEMAQADSQQREVAERSDRLARLRALLNSENIRTLFQPIFDLRTMEVVAYEALSRGPSDSEFERPDKLFGVAYDGDLVMRLERVCRRKALERAAELPADRRVFINIEPEAVCDPQLRDVAADARENAALVSPERVVLEVTERSAIRDFPSFRATLEYVRALGFAVAVDDAGAGYGSLQCLAEVQPDWLKVDMSLVRDCHEDDVRATLVRSLAEFAEQTDAALIAEGIETESELVKLREMGVRYGQGFLLGGPVEAPPDETSFPAKRYALP